MEIIKLAKQFNHASYCRKQRIQERIGFSVGLGHCFFLTLTFTDEVLASTSAATRRRYVSRFLKSTCPFYVANLDYGGKRGREHYHAVVMADRVNYKAWHKYGAIRGDRVHSSNADEARVCEYLSKLTNHSLKASCGKLPRIIYSRNARDIRRFFADPPF